MGLLTKPILWKSFKFTKKYQLCHLYFWKETMQYKKIYTPLLLFGFLFLFSVLFLFDNPQPVSAQCGSQASSCKNCHEVQGNDPVNQDGTSWHEPHAFGDFCEFCHAGNVQSPVQEEAHVGMIAPLANVEAACSTCHENYLELAAGYASTLGVELGDATTTPTEPDPVLVEAQPNESPSAVNDCAMVSAIYYDEADLIDYSKQYENTVLGFRDINKGNLILGFLSLAMISGGGLFVAVNEKWLTISTKHIPDTVDGFGADTVELLPALEKVDSNGRKALKKLLKKPEKAAEVFKAVADIDE